MNKEIKILLGPREIDSRIITAFLLPAEYHIKSK